MSLLFFVFCLSLPPLFYLYIKSLTKDFSFEGEIENTVRHFYPPIALLIINLFSFVFLSLSKEDYEYNEYVINVMNYSNLIALYFIFLIQVFFYLFKSILLYKDYKKALHKIYSYEEGVSLNWMITYITGFFIFICMVYVVQIGLPFGNFVFGLLILIYILFINIKAFRQNEVYELVLINEPDIEENTTVENITPEWQDQLQQKLNKAINEDKIYLQDDLTLRKLANKLDTNTKYLSQTINQVYDKNFSSYINEYRIKESMKIIDNPESEIFTLESIAQQSGFKSRSAFISAFKKYMNMTPSEYKSKTKP